jgi:MFS family permease
VSPERRSPGAAVPPTVKGLSLVSFLNDFSSEMVYPLLPAFVTRVLGGGAAALGILDGAADLTAALLRWGSGRLADRKGWSSRLILGGYGLAVVVRPVVAATIAAWQVIGLRILDRVGKGLRSPARDAMIAQVTPAPLRGRAYGFNRGADHLGAVAGSLAAWGFLSWNTNLRAVLLASAVPGLLALMVLVPVLRGSERKEDQRETLEGADAQHPGGDAAGRRFWLPVIGLTLLTAARLPETLLILRLQDLGVAVALIPLVWAGLHVVRSLSAYPGGRASDRFGPAVMLGIGGIIFAVVSLVLARPVGLVAAVAVFLALGLVSGFTEASERAVVAALTPKRTGRGFGYAQGLAGIVALPAGLGFGALYQIRGGPAALMASGLAMSLAVVLWLVASKLNRVR